MNVIIWMLVFVISMYVLVKSADYFTIYAEKLGKVLNFPSFVTGVLIIAIGTSIPELGTSIISVLQGTTEVVAANVGGSNIANILLGIGIAAIFAKKHIKLKWDIFYGDMPILVGATIIFFFTIIDGKITLLESIIFLLGYVLYLNYIRQIRKLNNAKSTEKFRWSIPIYLILSLVLVFFSSKYTIMSIIEIATFFNIGVSVIVSSAVAIGTSLPEIAVAATVVKKGNIDMLMGDIIGSNIFNFLAIIGISGLISQLVVEAVVINTVLPFVIASLVVLWVISVDKEISHSEGAFMVLLYFLFLGVLFKIF